MRAIEAFRAPHFAAVWTSNLLQSFAGQVYLMTLLWLVTDLTESRTLLGLVMTISGVTLALTSPIAGVAADRFARRGILIFGRLGTLAVVLALTALVYGGRIELWHILLAAVSTGLLLSLTQPATQTYIFDIVGPERTQTAVALNSAGTGLGLMAGPALAGVLIAGVGIVGSWLGAALGLLLAAGLLLRIPIHGRGHGEKHAPWRELREGFDYVLRRPPVLLALLACTMAFFNGAIFTMRPIFARYVLDVGSEGMGMMAAAAGFGTLLGASTATLLPDFRRPGLAIVLSMLAFSVCILLYAFAFSFRYILVIEFASGLAAQLWQISTFSGLQMSVPARLRGRVMGMVFMVVQLAQVGGVFVGTLADRVGDQLAMGIFGAVPIVILGLLLVFGHRQVRALGADGPYYDRSDGASD